MPHGTSARPPPPASASPQPPPPPPPHRAGTPRSPPPPPRPPPAGERQPTATRASTSAWSGNPLIVTVAPNGAYKQPRDHAALPITADALAATARACLDAGAAMLHMHIRDAQGRHSLDLQGYRAAIHRVRQAVGQAL